MYRICEESDTINSFKPASRTTSDQAKSFPDIAPVYHAELHPDYGKINLPLLLSNWCCKEGPLSDGTCNVLICQPYRHTHLGPRNINESQK